jgi:hypothetical protein
VPKIKIHLFQHTNKTFLFCVRTRIGRQETRLLSSHI